MDDSTPTTTVFGVEVDELPEGVTPLEVVVLVKALDEAGDVCIYTRESATLTMWEAMGMLQMVADQRRNDCLESYEAGPD